MIFVHIFTWALIVYFVLAILGGPFLVGRPRKVAPVWRVKDIVTVQVFAATIVFLLLVLMFT